MAYFLGQLPVTSSGRTCTVKVIETSEGRRGGYGCMEQIKVRGVWPMGAPGMSRGGRQQLSES
jgi:hypothetical protein